MSDASLTAEVRDGRGKGVARKLRATGRIPAVVYGRGRDSQPLTVDPAALSKLLHAGHSGMNTLIDLTVAGRKSVVLVRDIQKDPVSGQWVHADLYVVDLTRTIQVEVPLHLIGKPAGIELGGILDHPMREVTVECLPRAIPDSIDVDVSALGIGDSIHVRDLVLPEGARILSDPDLAVASVVLPKAEEERVAEAVPAEGAEAAPAVEGAAEATPAEE
ncbi:MAG TPA: 50S ribosomal protein L25 [Myxococcota bacterium]|nr:50S ribosomal protein L25 [Myxococcota bacterium]